MSTAKIAISIDSKLLNKIDSFVKKSVFKSRSQAVQIAVMQALEHLDKKRLAEESKKLDPKLEQAMADEYFSHEDNKEWPEY